MKNNMFKNKITLLAVAGVTVFGLSACSSGETILEPEVKITFANEEGSEKMPTKMEMIEPGDFGNTETVTTQVGGVVFVGKALANDFLLWEGTSSDETVVKFHPAEVKGNISSSGYFEALKKGTSTVTITNSSTGETKTTTIIVE